VVALPLITSRLRACRPGFREPDLWGVEIGLVNASDGTPMNISSVAGLPQNQITITVPAGGVAQFQTSGTGSLKTGWAKVQSNQRLVGIALYSFFDTSGNFVREVGVQPSIALRSMSLFTESGSAFTGVALANPNTAAACQVRR
jgi:hypothetical protein